MQQRPSWEADRFSVSQEFPLILCNLKVRYRIQKCPPTVLILNQLDGVHTSTSHFLKTQLNVILPSTPGCSKWILSLNIPHQNPVYTVPLPHTFYMYHPSHSSLFVHPKNFGWGVEIMKFLVMQFSPLPCFLARLTNILLSTLFSNTLCLRC